MVNCEEKDCKVLRKCLKRIVVKRRQRSQLTILSALLIHPFFRFCFEENSHHSKKTSICSQQKKLFLHLHETQMQVERKKNMSLLHDYFGTEAMIERRAIRPPQILHIILNVSYSLVRDAHTYSGLLNLHTISINSIDWFELLKQDYCYGGLRRVSGWPCTERDRSSQKHMPSLCIKNVQVAVIIGFISRVANKINDGSTTTKELPWWAILKYW